LFNWLWAKHLRAQGQEAEFLIRVEDTDLERSKPELIDVIFEVLNWLGIDWDGEPVYQSARSGEHHAAVQKLLASGHAYRCDCTQEAAQERAKERGTPGYDGFCRDRNVSETTPHVVRFRVPDDGATTFDDLIRGTVTFEHRNLEDFVLQRRDGTPMFIVANTVDDADMGITHVIRGEDLINVTPKMLLVRAALGHADRPTFAHLPLIVNDQRKKLSKRRDDVSVADYQRRGFLPEAMVNYLVLLGWGPPDGVEVRPLSEIVELFEVSAINQSPAMFDVKKLEAINGDYIRAMDPAEFANRSLPYIEAVEWADRFDPEVFGGIAPEVQTRVKVLSEVPGYVDFLFLDAPEIDEASWSKAISGNDMAPQMLAGAIDAFEALSPEEWTAEKLHHVTVALAEAAGLKLGKAQAPIRVAVTGRTVGPPLFESLELLGKPQVLKRLGAAREQL
jgi:glutamyl-tRNA synthetase